MRAHLRFKAGGRRRLLGAAAVALALLALLVWLGPDQESVRRRFEFTGAEGPLRIMPELSIEEGHDARRQLPRYYRQNPPPPSYEVEPEPLEKEAEIHVPIRREEPVRESETVDPTQDPDLDEVSLVEMNLPRMTNPDFVLEHWVLPRYPAGATEQQRRLPVITVEAALYVDEEGQVTATMIVSSEGGPVFDEVVLRAIRQWRFRVVAPTGRAEQGFWYRVPFRFKSPYD